jgi:hypothetical protein
MCNKKDIENLAGMVKALFEEKLGGFRMEDFVAVARELGFNVVGMRGAGEKIEYTYHKQQQPGEGFWALAPGAGDVSEGMVWVSKKSS